MKTTALALAVAGASALASASGAGQKSMLVTLSGVEGVHPGMTVAAVNRRWGTSLRPVAVQEGCSSAIFSRGVSKGIVYFGPRGFGAVSFSAGARTAAGIVVGSSEQQLRKAYAGLKRQPDKYVPKAFEYFLRRKAAPRWWLRFDVSPQHRVTQIWFGNEMTQLVEGCS
jgi:hypothetical protein